MTPTSVMLTTYNRLSLTQRMLNNFFRVTTSPYNLIVVDNGSSDATPEFLHNLKSDIENKNLGYFTSFHHEFMHKYCLSFTPIFNEHNKGIATGRNQGLKQAATNSDEWFATLDNDIELPENWLNDCIDIICANPKFMIGVNLEDVSYPLMTQNGKTFQYKAKGNLGSACMVFNRDLHNKIGYFTTEYQKYGEEDSDLGFRSRLAGYNLGYLQKHGVHFGVGELDVGEYRKFKDECRAQNIVKFQQNCYAYTRKEKPIYIPYSEKQ